MSELRTRIAEPRDAEAIAAIYNQGIEERGATFQTKLHDPGELELKVEQRGGQLLIADVGGTVVGWAGWTGYDDPAEHYAGVGECAVYVTRDARRGGVAAALLAGLAEEAPKAGLHKFVAKIFSSNQASIDLFRRAGYREVGVHRRHGRLEGEWRDVVLMELLLGDA